MAGQPIRLLYIQLVEAISEGEAIRLLLVILLQIGPGQRAPAGRVVVLQLDLAKAGDAAVEFGRHARNIPGTAVFGEATRNFSSVKIKDTPRKINAVNQKT